MKESIVETSDVEAWLSTKKYNVHLHKMLKKLHSQTI